jgi:gamma-glutamyltranspeptidase / glutathione hydrolase
MFSNTFRRPAIGAFSAFFILSSVLPLNAREPVRARHAMVIASEPAEQAGLEILRKGGNAIDAAIAVGFALNAALPYAGALGGGGFMTIRLADGTTNFIDFREEAPGKATRNMYVDANGNATRESTTGWKSSGVPGTVRGFELAQKKYGKLKWAEDLQPAITMASKGFPAPWSLAQSLRTARNLTSNPESKRVYQRDGQFYEQGDTVTFPDLARTLTRIAEKGPDEFYMGETAHTFAAAMEANGGLITLDDLKNYKAVERTPLTGRYRNYTVITAPPPSAGGVGLLQMLAMLEGSGYEKGGFGSASALHYEAEVMRRFYADRSQYLGDPDFVRNPIAGLLDPAYIASRRASIDPAHATPSSAVGPGKPAGAESTETTHFDVVDEQGNAVSVTFTLNGGYGNGITVPGLGMLLNNEMDDFTSRPGIPNMFKLVQGEPNTIVPGKRPLSSMAPTIVLRDDKLFAVFGGPGGSRIPSAELQAFVDVVDFGMNPQDAVDAPRIHHQWLPDRITMERGLSPDTLDLLRARGHEVIYEPGLVTAEVEMILIDGGWLQGAPDPRRAGAAAGY